MVLWDFVFFITSLFTSQYSRFDFIGLPKLLTQRGKVFNGDDVISTVWAISIFREPSRNAVLVEFVITGFQSSNVGRIVQRSQANSAVGSVS